MKTANKKIRCKTSVPAKKKTGNNNRKKIIAKLLNDAFEYQQKKQLEQANFLYQKVLLQEPKNICALNGLGLIALNTGMFVLASEFFDSAYNVEPNNTAVNSNLGLVYTKLADYKKAIQHYNYILDTDSNNAEIHTRVARLFQQLDEPDASLAHYRSAFELNPGDPENFQGLVQLDAKSVTTEDISIVENYLLKPDLPLDVRCSFYFSLGAVYDISEKYDEAFANYSVANISKIATFDADRHIDYISDIIQTFSSDFFEQQKQFALNHSAQPVFIVGMPQSGMATVENLLINNNDIYAAGELNLINIIAEKLHLTPEGMPRKVIDGELLTEFSRFYLSHTNALAIDESNRVPSRIIDRKPSNFLHLGLISLLFPKAKIIHCVANPLEICLSNYFKNYSSDYRYSYDQKNIALYYQQYERLMAHWVKILPIDIFTVNRDDVVNFPDKTGRQLFEFIDLPWQTASIEAPTSTQYASIKNAMQCKYSTYQSPTRHWHKYRKYAHAMIQELTILGSGEGTTKPVNVR